MPWRRPSLCSTPDAGTIEILHTHATEEQRERFLRPLVEGKIRSCFSMTEPEMPGSNPVMMQQRRSSTVPPTSSNGQKWFTSSADGADFAIVMAVTNPDASPQSCRVPQSNLLGHEGAGFTMAQERLGPGRIHHCMRWLGIASRAFDMMCQRANTRMITPEGDRLADRQVIQHWSAELDAEIRGARLQTLHAAWLIDRDGTKAARDEISAIKFSVANTMLHAVDKAIQVHGALGVTDDTILAYWYRHERAARIYDGADEVHKTTLGRRILGRYRTRPKAVRAG